MTQLGHRARPIRCILCCRLAKGKKVPLGLGHQMKRRAFIGLVAAAAAWPVVAQAQRPAIPLIGYVSGRSPAESANIVAAFHQGLKEAGFVEGQNVAIEARFAEGNFDLLPALTADLIRREVNVLVTAGGTVTAVRAMPVVPASVPMVFVIGGDPVKLGIVASLNRPGGNITGVSFLINELAAKEIELLHELTPNASVIGFLVNPKDPNLESDMRGAKAAAETLGKKLVVVEASTEGEIDTAFSNLIQQNAAALFVDVDPLFAGQRAKIIALAAQHKLPLVAQVREFADAGGLATYGTSLIDANRQLGAYVGLVLKGAKPADLPIQQSSKFELVINLKTAKTLGLTVSLSLIARADEVID
jgi:putative tryptophan/tyrosine transport system substrate-binding protein